DWQDTLSALLKELDALPEECSSSVGRWTRVGVLFGTGDVSDAQKGAYISDELTRDRERFAGWALRETYCSVDPCDPATVRPENVVATAQNYREIDLENVAIS